MKPSIFDVKNNIETFGIWFAIYQYGFRNWWTIWVATRVIKREKARGAGTEWYNNR